MAKEPAKETTGRTMGDFFHKVYEDSKPIAKDAYEVSAAYGKIKATFSMIFGVVFALIFIGVGFFLLHASWQTEEVNGTVKLLKKECELQSKPDAIVNGKQTYKNTFMCQVIVEYAYGGKIYTVEMIYEGEKAVVQGQNIPVYVNKSNPESSQFTEVPMWVGLLVLILGIITMAAAVYYYYIATKFKAVAAAQGASSILSGGT
jgi:hypothetical protein